LVITVGHYRDRDDLILSKRIANSSSILLVVGRQDTGDLEAQVRGSRHAWTVRIISADALSKLVELKESAELASAAKIHELLVPFEYTRLDKIIDIAFTVAEEAGEAAEEQGTPVGITITQYGADSPIKQQHTPLDTIEQVRAEIVHVLSRTYSPLVKRSRALYWSADKSVRATITISKRYENGGFWYAYHPSWDAFLGDAATGFLVLGCVGSSEAFAIPHSWIRSKLEFLYTTERDSTKYWHLVLQPNDEGHMLLRLNNGLSESLEPFKLKLPASIATSA
jgi:hypothetical protein